MILLWSGYGLGIITNISFMRDKELGLADLIGVDLQQSYGKYCMGQLLELS